MFHPQGFHLLSKCRQLTRSRSKLLVHGTELCFCFLPLWRWFGFFCRLWLFFLCCLRLLPFWSRLSFLSWFWFLLLRRLSFFPLWSRRCFFHWLCLFRLGSSRPRLLPLRSRFGLFDRLWLLLLGCRLGFFPLWSH